MKEKYIITVESGINPDTGEAVSKKLKTFKNERDAISFVKDPKNIRMYRYMSLTCRKGEEGIIRTWDEKRECWN